MAGSRGKHSKSKGKSKSRKSNAVDKKSETCDCDKKCASGCVMATCRSNYKEYEVAELLYTKIECLYTDAIFELSKLGHTPPDIERAILKTGYLGGPTDYLLDNIVVNALAYLEGKEKCEERKYCANMHELYGYIVHVMVDATMKHEPTATIPDAMWLLLLSKWPTGMYSRNQGIIKVADPVESSSSSQKRFCEDADSDCNAKRISILRSLIDHSKKNVITLAADIRRRLSNISEQDFPNEHDNIMEASEVDTDFQDYIQSSSVEEFLNGLPENGSGNPQIAMVSYLAETIRKLEEDVERTKEWAQQKVIHAAEKVSQNLLEINLLRMEGDASKKEHELKRAERYATLALIEMEQNLREKMDEVEFANAGVRSLEQDNAQIRSEIEASNLCLDISSRNLEEAVKRERRYLKMAKDLDEQCIRLQEQCDEDKKRVLKLQQELQQIEKDSMETEVRYLLDQNLEP